MEAPAGQDSNTLRRPNISRSASAVADLAEAGADSAAPPTDLDSPRSTDFAASGSVRKLYCNARIHATMTQAQNHEWAPTARRMWIDRKISRSRNPGHRTRMAAQKWCSTFQCLFSVAALAVATLGDAC